MIIVTGAQRSGTSAWMQALQAGGFPIIGEDFNAVTGPAKAANVRGFYESKHLAGGVYWETNPTPDGQYLDHRLTQHHALKLFFRGLIRTDMAYIDHVIWTVRPWREQELSLRRMFQMRHPTEGFLPGTPYKPLPPGVHWFLSNWMILQNFAVRRFPIMLCPFDLLLKTPARPLSVVFEKIGAGDADKARRVIAPTLRTYRGDAGANLDSPWADNFDWFYHALSEGDVHDPTFITDFARISKEIVGQLKKGGLL